MDFAQKSELEAFLQKNPEVQLLEVLMPDYNGMLRCKRIQRREFAALFDGKFTVPITVPVLGILGNLYPGQDQQVIGGDPDQQLRPLSGTLAPIPWLDSPTAQVLTAYVDSDGSLGTFDPQLPLQRVLDRYRQKGYSPVVATELEFYLLEDSEGRLPRPLRGRIPGTALQQEGIQYCMPDDLIDCDAFLEDVRKACEIQSVPMTAIHSEFSPGQWEINTHHRNDAIQAGRDALLLRRIIKAVARRHGMGATFMAKPFTELAGSGMHIHASVYDASGANVLAASESADPPVLSPALRHAVGGLAETINEAMALFAPNPNSYRRFKAGAFAPSGPSWGYDHREVALRIPASGEKDRRIEHRIAGADANPFFVLAGVLAGILYGLEAKCDPGEPMAREADLSDDTVTLPTRVDAALQSFRSSEVMADYLGADFVSTYAWQRQGESDYFHGEVPDLDYRLYLRAL